MSDYSSRLQLWASTKGARCPARLGLDSSSLNLSITQGQLAVNAMGIGAAILIMASILLTRYHQCRHTLFRKRGDPTSMHTFESILTAWEFAARQVADLSR